MLMWRHGGLRFVQDRTLRFERHHYLRGAGFHGRRSNNLAPLLNWDFTQPGLPAAIQSARASGATVWDANGNLATVGSNVPRQTFLPGVAGQTSAQGLLSEPAGSNQLRNPLGVGASAGTPGTPPTDWIINVGATGLSTQIVSTGIESNISYVDIRFYGTASSDFIRVWTESGAIAATAGKIETISLFGRLVNGTYTNITSSSLMFLDPNGSGHVGLISNFTSTSLASQRQQFSASIVANGSITYPGLQMAVAAGAVDITLRIGLPQLEQSPVATSPMFPSAGNTGVTNRAEDRSYFARPIVWGNGPVSLVVGLVDFDTSRTYARIIGSIDNEVSALFANDGSVGAYSGGFIYNGPSGLQQDVNAMVGYSYDGLTTLVGLNGNVTSTTSVGPCSPPINAGLGCSQNGGSEVLNGVFSRMQMFPRAMSAAELQMRTT